MSRTPQLFDADFNLVEQLAQRCAVLSLANDPRMRLRDRDGAEAEAIRSLYAERYEDYRQAAVQAEANIRRVAAKLFAMHCMPHLVQLLYSSAPTRSNTGRAPLSASTVPTE